MMYVGVDVGKSKCRAAMMNQEGKITKEFSFSNDSEGISWLSSMLTRSSYPAHDKEDEPPDENSGN